MPPPRDQAEYGVNYQAMCNSLMERFNATLKICLRRLCSENGNRDIDTSILSYLPTARCRRSRLIVHISRCSTGKPFVAHAYLEGVVDESDPGVKYEGMLRIRP
ncbi:hypothetical protein PoB_007345900 [Plakobranchus ocellatus]|uniref:Integrase catalytic domain-containing protein n=1 Tax=Plakobranchus ocellatus TaxID=259542 RepID=A0AAV4DS20_9GAST|nr:hypothetical protein PoB_007345900 [Plakobranchus ocellatus]